MFQILVISNLLDAGDSDDSEQPLSPNKDGEPVSLKFTASKVD